ncbi:MAG: hypothetical protein DWQ10_11100 [Calditrichaeota bacterium]|nr:MAG: hypothetical protein DWQ10_11100 [Calditrichota bacterium]
MKAPFIHPNALVESENIGNGSSIWAFTHIMKNARIGTNCNIGDHNFIESGVIIGNNVTLIGEHAECDMCGGKYTIQNNKILPL